MNAQKGTFWGSQNRFRPGEVSAAHLTFVIFRLHREMSLVSNRPSFTGALPGEYRPQQGAWPARTRKKVSALLREVDHMFDKVFTSRNGSGLIKFDNPRCRFGNRGIQHNISLMAGPTRKASGRNRSERR